MSVPDWWEVLLLGAAAWRTFQLLAYDDILNWLRRYVTRLPQEWKQGQSTPLGFRPGLSAFIQCPYCMGWWIALVWWGAWHAWGDGTLVVASAFALSAAVVAGHKLLSSE